MNIMATLKDFKTFYDNFQKLGKDPRQAVQELLNSGEMTQAQYNDLSQQANAILGFMPK